MRIVRRNFVAMFLLISFLSVPGCSTVFMHSGLGIQGEKPCEFPYYVYGGTLSNALLFSEGITGIGKHGGGAVFLTAYSVIDFPLSLVADTLMLPIAAARDIHSCTVGTGDSISDS